MKILQNFMKQSEVELEIERLTKRLVGTDDRDEFEWLLTQIERLSDLDTRKKSTKRKVSLDTLVGAGTNLAGILLVLNYEKLDIITSKAFSCIIKGRV